MTDPINTFAVVLTQAPRFFLISDPNVTGPLTLDGRTFLDVRDLGTWVGFYDWLRTMDGRLVGVRSWLDGPDVDAFRAELAKHKAVEVVGPEVRIWWSQSRFFSELASDDQDLGDHRILQASDGILVVTFDIEGMSAEERSCLESLAST